MNTTDFVSVVRSSCVDELVDSYAQLFSETPIEKFADADMCELASAWRAASPELRQNMKAFMRLGSQNTAAKILALMDEDFGIGDHELTLSARGSDGTKEGLSRDLLNSFWAQEQSAGRVNRPKR